MADYGNCGFDYRQIFNLSFLAVSPKFSGLWANRLLGGWQLAPLVTAHSGTWFSPSTGVDRSPTGIGLDRPNLVMSNPYLRQTTGKLQWINTAAYAENALGTFGNDGRDSLLGPAYFDIDADVSRYFQMPWSESQRLELRFEFFDLANNIDFSTPNATLTSTSFGRITSTATSGFARILQFALKYYF